MITVYTFGDSILDCGHYNPHGVTPGGLIVRNDDRLFPEFRGRDLSSMAETRLVHRAVDGSTVEDLPDQVRGLDFIGRSCGLITIGGNDLLAGLALDHGPGIEAFAEALDGFVRDLPICPVFLGSVYDPTVGDDRNNTFGIDPATARANLHRVNRAIRSVAECYGEFVDLHAHFLTGDLSWFVRTIEPSLRGVSEIRRCFLQPILRSFASDAKP